jgi:NO-binding membrane sensor protein with MHYT domain
MYQLYAGLITLSAVVALIASCTAFWLLIRVLEWRQNMTSLRIGATLIMVCPSSGLLCFDRIKYMQ